jgi:pSer/pThr/pTyr-binding forkhead associated (FHA) protein
MTVILQLHEGVAINKFALDKKLIRIGRDPDCEIFIDDKVVSMEHAVIEAIDVPENKGQKEFYIKDLGSTNSTFVNDKQITRQKLNHDDLIRVGWTSLRFVKEIDRKTEKTLKIHKSWIPGVYYTKE